MRNPNRTTKRERGAVRRRLTAACRRWGIAYTARASRTLTDAVIRLALVLDVPPHIIAGSDPGSNHWSATVEPPPFVYESWPHENRIRISGFGGTATFTQDELAVKIEGFATGGYVESPPDLIAPTGCPPFDTSLYSRYRRTFDAEWCVPDDMAALYSQAEHARKAYADKLWSQTPGILPLEEFEQGDYEGARADGEDNE